MVGENGEMVQGRWLKCFLGSMIEKECIQNQTTAMKPPLGLITFSQCWIISQTQNRKIVDRDLFARYNNLLQSCHILLLLEDWVNSISHT